MARLKLAELLTHDNTRMAEYRGLSRRQGDRGTQFGTTFTKLWHMPLLDEEFPGEFPNIRKRLGNALRDGILLDVGCGDRDSRYFMLAIAKRYGAAHYIGLDQHEIDGNQFEIANVEYEKRTFAPIRLYYHQEDMLSFLAKLQSETMAAVAINGIDGLVIPDGEYHYALAREMARVLRPNGIVFGINSVAGYYLEEFGLMENPAIIPLEFSRGFGGECFFLEKPGAAE